MEELNKQQLILLALLLSFVTSIATGIVTVTLMDQAPPAVTQTINRVVERTIETVVPKEQSAVTVVREIVKEIPVNENEIVFKVVKEAAPAIAKLFAVVSPASGEEVLQELVLGSGFFLLGDRIISARSILPPVAARGVPAKDGEVTQIVSYGAVLSDGRTLPVEIAEVTGSASTTPILTFKILQSAGQKGAEESLTFATSSADVYPGQTVLALGAIDRGGRFNFNVSTGIISSLAEFTSGEAKYPAWNADVVNDGNVGGPVLNMDGRVIGIGYAPGLVVSSGSIDLNE